MKALDNETTSGREKFYDIFIMYGETNCDALGVFCDFSNAFDCVLHETLMRELHHSGTSLNLFISFRFRELM